MVVHVGRVRRCEVLGIKLEDAVAQSPELRTLMDSGRCVYTYFGGSFIELPHKEGAEN